MHPLVVRGGHVEPTVLHHEYVHVRLPDPESVVVVYHVTIVCMSKSLYICLVPYYIKWAKFSWT